MQKANAYKKIRFVDSAKQCWRFIGNADLIKHHALCICHVQFLGFQLSHLSHLSQLSRFAPVVPVVPIVPVVPVVPAVSFCPK